MNMTHFTLAREELVTDPFALAYGRRVVATLEANPYVYAGAAPAEPDTLQLIVESRANSDEPFTELARTRVISEAGSVSVELPVAEVPIVTRDPHDKNPFAGLPPAPPSARVRIIHTGRLLPRFSVTLAGL